MPNELGGRSDKEGNRYEIKYTILKILEVIEEKIDYVILEAIGDEEKGVDIWIGEKNGTKEGQQCKIRNSSKDSWDFGSANSKKIFENWKIQLDRDSNNKVSLVTPLAFQNLDDLLKRTKNSNDNAEDFYNFQIKNSSNKFHSFYENFCQAMCLNTDDKMDIQKSINYLKRIEFHQIPDSYLKEMIFSKISYLFSNDKKNVYSHFITWIIDGDILGKLININLIYQFIKVNNLQLKNLSLDNRITPRIDQLNREYRESFQTLNNSFIERKKFKEIPKLINDTNSMIIHGKAGMGKSGFTEAVIRHCELKNISYLAIKLDNRIPNLSAKRWGEDLGLPDSIAHCLHSIAKNERAVLILDQLDALRWTLAHSRSALLVCSEIIQQINHLNQERKHKISVVMVCRTIDLENDNNIRNLFKEFKKSESCIRWKKIKVDELEDAEVERIVGEKYRSLTPKLKTLLKIPSNLFIWCQLDKDKLYDECLSTNHLIEKWWDQLSSDYSKRGHILKDLSSFKKELVNKFIELERMYVPKRFFEGNKSEIDFLASNEFITLSDNKISFAHQSILDFLLSEKMLERYFDGSPMKEILGDKDLQTPGKRYQLQMLMQLLLEIDSADFIKVGKQLLESSDIRFFNKYVFFEILRDVDVLDKNISDFILSYCENEKWKEHLLNNVIYSKSIYYKLLLNNGFINKWLEDGTNKDYAINLIASIAPDYDLKDIKLIEKYIFLTEENSRKFSKCFSNDLSKDTDEMFDLRLELYTKYPELNYFYINFNTNLEQNEYRTIKYIEFLMINKLSSRIHHFQKFERNFFVEDNEFLISQGEEVIKILLKFIPREKRAVYDFSEWSAKHYKDSLERIVVRIIKKAIKSIINTNPEKFKEIVVDLASNSNDVINEIILDGLFHLNEDCSDFVIEFICNNFKERIFIRSFGDGDELSIVKKVLKKHSISCSDQTFYLLESTIINFISEDAKDILKRRIEYVKENKDERVYWSYWGDLQLELLAVLPKQRLSHNSFELLNVLKRKFKEGNKRYKYYLGGGGSVKSPVSGKKLSPENWLAIITRKKEDFDIKEISREGEDGIVRSSEKQFAISFTEAVRQGPLEMTLLILNNANSVNERFVDALYDGLTSCDLANVPKDVIEKLFLCFPSDSHSYRARNFCEIIENSSYIKWSFNTLNMLMDIAINHKNPNIENPVIISNDEKEMRSFDRLYIKSLNSVSGRAAKTIEHLLWENPDYYTLFKSTVIELTNDSNPEVKLASVFTLRSLINVDKEWALTKIINLYTEDFRLAGHVSLRDIFFLAYNQHREEVLQIIIKCFTSMDKDLIKVGAYVIAEMYIVKDEFKELIENSEAFSKEQSQAFLEMIVIYFDKDEYNEQCKNIMIKFSNTNYDFELVFSKLFYDNLIKLDRDYDFLTTLMQSKVSKKLIYSFVEYLHDEGKSIFEFSEIILLLSANLINNFSHDENDSWGIEKELSKLIIGLYDETCKSEDLKLHHVSIESLKLWDKMFELRIGSIRELSKEIMVR